MQGYVKLAYSMILISFKYALSLEFMWCLSAVTRRITVNGCLFNVICLARTNVCI